MAKSDPICSACGQVQGVQEYDNKLWDLYHRLDDGGRKFIEPLVYTQSDFEEMGYSSMHDMDEDSYDAVMISMERNMVQRGLCGECGRPNLEGKTAKDFMSQEDADALADMHAEMEAERRAGC